jgi:glycosyltransferase involved in cell wall biosynthesis
MKIALLNTDDSSGGAAIACIRLAETLIAKGHNVKMFTLNSDGKHSFVEPLVKSFWTKKIAIINFILERLYFLFFEKNKALRFAFSPANFGFDITQSFEFKHFDIIHIHWVNFGFLSLNDLEKLFSLKKPIVWTLHDMWAFTGGCHHSGACENFQNACGNCISYLKNPKSEDISNSQLIRKKEIYENIPITVVGCSQWIAERAKKSSVFKNKLVVSIPNPLDLDVFKPIKMGKKEFGLTSEKKYILIAAMKVTVIWKGFGFLKEALKLFSQKLTELEKNNIEILVAGNANLVDFEDIPFKCNLLGRINSPEKMNQIYNLAEVFVSSSIQENLPNTIMEAMAAGTPCVAFGVGGIPEMIEHKKTGYIAEPENSGDLAAGIKFVFDNKSNILFGTNSRKIVNQSYTNDVVTDKYLELYHNIILK